MTMLSIRFSQALAKGRKLAEPADTRSAVLRSLLRKRATARTIGANDLEAMLREQILWSLPVHRNDDPKGELDRAC